MSPPARETVQTAPCPPNAILTDDPKTEPEPNPTETNTPEELTYPDGGLQAWLVVLGSFCGMYLSTHPIHPPTPTPKANQKKTKASLLRLHEQHQHLQHLPLHPPTRPLQRELHRLDLQRIHLPDLPVRYFHRSSLRCQRAAGAGVCGECVDDGEYYADGGLHRWVSSNLPFHFEAVPFANCAYKNSGIFSSSLVF